MDQHQRARRAERALAGYPSGPDAPQVATALAWERIDGAEAVILVEGIGDQMAIDALALRRGRNLDDEGVVVFPVGGAQAFPAAVRELGPLGDDLPLTGLADADGERALRRSLNGGGLGPARTLEDMADRGFFFCRQDLEEELIRACGVDLVLDVVEDQGELVSFERLQKQPQWRGRPPADQLHRFFKAKSGRDLRYARLLVNAAPLDRIPEPLDAVLARS